MRVVSGKAARIELATLKGSATRPTCSMVKQAVFSMLYHSVQGARVLDLFAGSGALGIEALSRGAAFCDFVDDNRRAVDVIKTNVNNTSFELQANIKCCGFHKFLNTTDKKYDLIFLDPPYRSGYVEQAIALIEKRQLLNEGGRIVCETDCREAINCSGLSIVKNSRYGNTQITILNMPNKSI